VPPSGGSRRPLSEAPQAAQEEEGTRRSASREGPPNAIQVSRRPRKARASRPEADPETKEPGANSQAKAASELPGSGAPPDGRTETDPWTVPQSIRDRFVQEGNRFYFPDGHAAFKDLGRKLTTASENTQVVRSLIEIAQSRGWAEIRVTGTDRFRQEAWRQARVAGLGVRGFRPTEEQRIQLIRALGRTRAPTGQGPEAVSESTSASTNSPEVPPEARPARPEKVTGLLLQHGKDQYRHDPDAEASYFVRIATRKGPREFWGKDLERAVAQSLTKPQLGEEVILQRTGRDPVNVKRQKVDDQGVPQEQTVKAYRNRWALERRTFMEERAVAARVVRDETVKPQEAVRSHPELAGTYLSLKAAELAAGTLRDTRDRQRFVSRVREALASEIERGEPLTPVRLRTRSRTRPAVAKARANGERTIEY
jgi:Large polyvalent protein-associated domain 7